VSRQIQIKPAIPILEEIETGFHFSDILAKEKLVLYNFIERHYDFHTIGYDDYY